MSASCWQLRAECWATSLPDGDRQLVDQVTETMQEMGLQPRQLERIQKAVLEAVQRGLLRGQPLKSVSLVHVRIWVAGKCARGRSWGFFIVEKPASNLQNAPAETEHLVELFLYQERKS